MVSHFASQDKHADVKRFFAIHPFPGIESYILRGLESIQNNMKWLSKESQSVEQFLQLLIE